jgi:hypothetical protein
MTEFEARVGDVWYLDHTYMNPNPLVVRLTERGYRVIVSNRFMTYGSMWTAGGLGNLENVTGFLVRTSEWELLSREEIADE